MTVTLATATPGGGFPLYGGVVAEVINAVDPSLGVECRNTKGSTENVPLLEPRARSISVSSRARWRSPTENRACSIVAAMYSTAGMFVVRGDSPARSIGDLKGKPVAFGAAGSGLVILARYVLDGMGLDMERDFPGDLSGARRRRPGDGAWTAAPRRCGAAASAGPASRASPRRAAASSRPTPTRQTSILAKHAFLKPLTVPAGAYPGQSAPIHSVGSWSFIMARPDLPGRYRLSPCQGAARG